MGSSSSSSSQVLPLPLPKAPLLLHPSPLPFLVEPLLLPLSLPLLLEPLLLSKPFPSKEPLPLVSTSTVEVLPAGTVDVVVDVLPAVSVKAQVLVRLGGAFWLCNCPCPSCV